MILALVLVMVDAIRFDAAKGGMMAVSAIIPFAYLAFFLFAPVFSNLNQSRPVPERVTG